MTKKRKQPTMQRKVRAPKKIASKWCLVDLMLEDDANFQAEWDTYDSEFQQIIRDTLTVDVYDVRDLTDEDRGRFFDALADMDE